MPELCGLVEESIGSNQNVVKLLTKMLPRFKHHAGTVNGFVSEKYGGANESLGKIGQGNIFSGVACRDASCIVLKNWKGRN